LELHATRDRSWFLSHQGSWLESWVIISGQLPTDYVHEHVSGIFILRNGEIERKTEVDDGNAWGAHVDSPAPMAEEQHLREQRGSGTSVWNIVWERTD
jgi:hypothetical protein